MAKERETVSLVDDEGNEHEFTVVDVLEVEARRYAVLQPAEGEGEAVIFRVEDDETLATVEDEEEFERVAAALEAMGTYDAVESGEDAGGGDDDEEDVEEDAADDDELDEEELEEDPSRA